MACSRLVRVVDIIFVVFFLIQIPTILMFDSQGVLPRWFFTEELRRPVEWYCKVFRDPLMSGCPVWFQAVCIWQLLLQLPFSVIAVYAFAKGLSEVTWIRVPAIMYCSHALTITATLIIYVTVSNFTGVSYPAPHTAGHRVILVTIYLPHVIMPILLLCRVILHGPKHESTQHQEDHERNTSIANRSISNLGISDYYLQPVPTLPRKY